MNKYANRKMFHKSIMFFCSVTVKEENKMTEQQIQKLLDRFVEHQEFFNKLSTEDKQWAIRNPKPAIALMCKAIDQREGKGSQILRLVAKDLAIPATDGSLIIADAKDVFAGWIDPDFGRWCADEHEPGEAAEALVLVDVHKIVGDAGFTKIFASLAPSSLSEDEAIKFVKTHFCLTQAQIIEFVKEHPQYLQQSGATFFLFKSRNQFFVAGVFVRAGGRLEVSVYRFGGPVVWSAWYALRLVVPQLA